MLRLLFDGLHAFCVGVVAEVGTVVVIEGETTTEMEALVQIGTTTVETGHDHIEFQPRILCTKFVMGGFFFNSIPRYILLIGD